MSTLIGKAAPPGSTIGIVTPGTQAESRAPVQRGMAWWREHGYEVKLLPGALEEADWHAGSPEIRARDIQQAFADPDIDAIQTMRGGYGSAQVIPLLDLDAIARSPKAFIGLSDITALHVAFNRLGLATFYGPSLTMVGEPSPPAFSTDRLLSVLGGETIGLVPPDDERLTAIAIAPGRASGRLLGGCLGDFIYTIGTPWEIDLADSIFFFEDVGIAPIRLDRALLYLDQIGKLNGVRGIVVGELAGSEWHEFQSSPRSKTPEEVLGARLGHLGIPIIYDLPLGHGATLATLPLGVAATLDADALTLTIDEPALAI